MTLAALSNSLMSGPSERRIWQIVAVVTVLHLLLVLVAKYGLPTFDPKKSEITIELGGVLLRGEGGTGVSSPASKASQGATAAAAASSASKPVTRDDLATKQSQTAAKPASAASDAAASKSAGVDAAPTTDADYSAAYLNNPKPPYPSVAFQMRIEGTVMLKALVLPDGSCGEVLLGRSSGNSLLDQSALNTVAQWKFVPAKSQGKDVSQWISIPIAFTLKRR